jgi:hypothetical protein
MRLKALEMLILMHFELQIADMSQLGAYTRERGLCSMQCALQHGHGPFKSLAHVRFFF